MIKPPENSSPDPVCLFLTDTALFVISSADDEFRQAYSLSKLNIRLTKPNGEHSHSDLLQLTLLIELDSHQADRQDPNNDETAAWPWEDMEGIPETLSPAVVISASHSCEFSRKRHFTKESFLLEWKDAKLFEELLLVAKSDV
jgi:hypothetical protein